MKKIPTFVCERHHFSNASSAHDEPQTYQKLVADGHPAGADYQKLRKLYDSLPWSAGEASRFVMAADAHAWVTMSPPDLLTASKNTNAPWRDRAFDTSAAVSGSAQWRNKVGTTRCVWTILLEDPWEVQHTDLDHLAWWTLHDQRGTGWRSRSFALPYAGSNDIVRWLLQKWQEHLLVEEDVLEFFLRGAVSSTKRHLPVIPEIADSLDAWL